MKNKKIKCQNPECNKIVDISDKKLYDLAKNEILLCIIKCKGCGHKNTIFKFDIDKIL